MNTSRISKPSLVIAVAAVTVGLVGTTTAVAGQRNVNNESRKTVTGPGADVATGDRFAVINANGTLARGKGVISATSFGGGSYEVLFNRNVARCVFVATIGSSASSGIEPTGEVTTVRRAGTTNGVFLTTTDSAGNRSDRGFHLLVGCP